MESFLFEQYQAWNDLGNGLSRQIVGYNKDLMQVKVRFLKGAIGTIHHHVHTQSSFVASGKFEVTINGDKKVLGPGDGFFVEPNASHGVVCIEAGVLVDTFTPAREDFL
jgi:quercetin dioxygenase-like cupin family protein